MEKKIKSLTERLYNSFRKRFYSFGRNINVVYSKNDIYNELWLEYLELKNADPEISDSEAEKQIYKSVKGKLQRELKKSIRTKPLKNREL